MQFGVHFRTNLECLNVDYSKNKYQQKCWQNDHVILLQALKKD